MQACDRRRLLRLLASAAAANAVSPSLFAGVASQKAVYRGGTIAGLTVPTLGRVSARHDQEFIFLFDEGELRIAYSEVNSLEYGQKAGRRLGLAITISPIFLLSRKRRHYLTIGFVDPEGDQNAVVLELGKKIVRSTIAGLEARTGLEVEFENEEARLAAKR